jgi:hypothetical protein
VALAAGLVAAWLFDRRARRNGHRPGADLRRFSHERDSHACSMPPQGDLGQAGFGPPELGPPGG